MNKVGGALPSRFWVVSILMALFLCVPLSRVFAEAEKSVPIQVHGDSVEYFHEAQKAVGTGHVVIDYEDTKLTADKITVYMETKKAVAEGNVVLTQKGSVFKGQRGEYDFGKKVGDVTGMEAEIQPSYFGKASRIQRLSDNHYRADDSVLTTCCGPNPLYTLQAKQVDIYPGEKVVIRNAILYLRGIPIFFIPYLEQHVIDLERFPAQLVAGQTHEWGPFVLSKWRYHLVERGDVESRGNFLLDYRVKRGVGGGVENFYRSDALGRGAARAYLAHDEFPDTEIDRNRTRLQWRHQMQLSESTTLTTESNKLSDRKIIKDFFFREEYESNVFPENYVSIITAKPEYTFSVLERYRLDDFLQVVERDPEMRFDTHQRAFAETPFYFRQEVQLSHLDKKFQDTDKDLEAVRFDTNTTLSYAGHVGAFSVTPHVGTRQTGYSREVDGDRSLWRGTFDGGVDTSIRFHRIYGFSTHLLGLDINQVRHIFTPTLSYNYRPNPTVSRTLLQQFDAIDAIDKQNFIRYQFLNTFQTKSRSSRKGELSPRDIARVLPFFDTDLHTGRLENAGFDVELRPYTWLGMDVDGTYDARTRDFNAVNTDVYLRRWGWRAGLGQRYLQNESSQTTLDLRYIPSPDLEFRVYERYEFEEDITKEFEFTVTKVWNCVITDLTYNHREETGDSFFVIVRLKAFPDAAFSIHKTYNQPKASTLEGPQEKNLLLL